jgi:ABC-type multidrug transport system fused ATPase/permease subunit
MKMDNDIFCYTLKIKYLIINLYIYISSVVTTGQTTTSELSSASSSAAAAVDTLSCSQTPKKLRKYFRKYQYGMLYNPEYNLDIGGKDGLKIVDVGDVLAGKTRNDTRQHLYTTVKELILTGAITFVVGIVMMLMMMLMLMMILMMRMMMMLMMLMLMMMTKIHIISNYYYRWF